MLLVKLLEKQSCFCFKELKCFKRSNVCYHGTITQIGIIYMGDSIYR